MKKRHLTILSIFLLMISLILYISQVMIFRQPETTAFYIFQDLAFLPVTIAIATLVVGYLMEEHDRQERINRTRMLTSSFFTDVGNELLRILITQGHYEIPLLLLTDECKNKTEEELKHSIEKMNFQVSWTPETEREIQNLLDAQHDSMLIITSNPALLDHEIFTDMLWAIFHLKDEMKGRASENISSADQKHLESDAKRVFDLLLLDWMNHLNYMKKEYPYYYDKSTKELYQWLTD